MNCSTCQENMSGYLSEKLSEDLMNSVQKHLEVCYACNAVYSAQMLTDKVIESEVSVQSNPFLSTRIMAEIDKQSMEVKRNVFSNVFQKMLQPALITLSLAAAVIIGIVVGQIYLSSDVNRSIPEELVYLDDASIESLSLLVTENDE